MRTHGIKARVATIRYTSPGIQRHFGSTRNEQLELRLSAPDQVWVGDITYLKVGELQRYLAVVMDKYSRRVVGWSYGRRRDVRLTLAALDRGCETGGLALGWCSTPTGAPNTRRSPSGSALPGSGSPKA